MDFGDILAKWDEQQKNAVKKQKESGKNQVSHKQEKPSVPTALMRTAGQRLTEKGILFMLRRWKS